jgi:hypothetical protein
MVGVDEQFGGVDRELVDLVEFARCPQRGVHWI